MRVAASRVNGTVELVLLYKESLPIYSKWPGRSVEGYVTSQIGVSGVECVQRHGMRLCFSVAPELRKAKPRVTGQYVKQLVVEMIQQLREEAAA